MREYGSSPQAVIETDLLDVRTGWVEAVGWGKLMRHLEGLEWGESLVVEA